MAYIGPIVYIDPTFMVDYNGTLMPVASRYTVEFPGLPKPRISLPFLGPLLLD